MSSAVLTLTERYDAILEQFSGRMASRITGDLERNYKELDNRIRREFDSLTQGYELIEAARLLQVQAQLGEALSIVPVNDPRYEATFRTLYERAESIGGEYGEKVLKLLEPNVLGQFSALPLEAITFATVDSVRRLQRYGDEFSDRAARTISTAVAQGLSYRQVSDQLRQYKDLTKYQAERIARTEANSVYVDATKERYRQRKVRHVRWIATGNERMCPWCGARNGQVYELDAVVVPAHPFCRCAISPFKPEWGEKTNADDFWKDYREDGLAELRSTGKQPNYLPSPFEEISPEPVDLPALYREVQSRNTPAPQPEPEPQPRPQPEPEPGPAGFEIFTVDQILEFGDEILRETAGSELATLASRINALDLESANDGIRRIELLTQSQSRSLNRKEKAEVKKLEARSREIWQERQALKSQGALEMGKLRFALRRAGLSVAEATEILASKDYSRLDLENPLAPDSGLIQRELNDLVRMTGGKGSRLLKAFSFSGRRANAGPNGDINVGESRYSPAVLWHEFAHLIEMELELGEVAEAFVLRRASGGEQLLSELTGNSAYGEKERAYPDRFVDPYVGKIYRGRYTPNTERATEVLSMGFERFYTPESMFELYVSDPEHFRFTLGTLRVERERRAAKLPPIKPLTKEEYKAEVKRQTKERDESFRRLIPKQRDEAMMSTALRESEGFRAILEEDKQRLLNSTNLGLRKEGERLDINKSIQELADQSVEDLLTEIHFFTGNANSAGALKYRRLIMERLGRNPEDDYYPPSTGDHENATLKELIERNITDGVWDRGKSTYMQVLKATLESDIQTNQRYTRDTLGDRFKLHRGITAGQAAELYKRYPDLKEGDEIEIELNALSSWTSIARVAGDYAKNKYAFTGNVGDAGMVLEADFSPEDIAFNSDITDRFQDPNTYKGRAGYELGVMSANKTVKVRIGKLYR